MRMRQKIGATDVVHAVVRFGAKAEVFFRSEATREAAHVDCNSSAGPIHSGRVNPSMCFSSAEEYSAISSMI